MKQVKIDANTTVYHHEDSNMPVAIAKKQTWGREVSLSPHPDLVKHYPDLAHRTHGVGADFPRNAKNKEEASLRVHSFFRDGLVKEFANKVDVRDERDKETRAGKVQFIDRSTGENMGHMEAHPAENAYSNGKHYVHVNQIYRKSHDIDDEILASKANLPKENHKQAVNYADVATCHSKFENMLGLKGKKSTLVGKYQREGNKTYHINGTEEEGSKAHEKHLVNNGFSIERHSPTKFTGTKTGDEKDTVHNSHTQDGKLHSHEREIYKNGHEYRTKPFSELIESTILTLESNDTEKVSKYSYVKKYLDLLK